MKGISALERQRCVFARYRHWGERDNRTPASTHRDRLSAESSGGQP
jgi:hypothetical protein